MPRTAMMYKFLAPLLSAQFMREATQRPVEIFNLDARPARPRFIFQADEVTCVGMKVLHFEPTA